jgi:hypothetical protein
VQIDVATFLQWVDARARHDTALANFYRARFRDEVKPTFAAWLATGPLTNPAAPPTPFVMPQYRLATNVEADRAKLAEPTARKAMLALGWVVFICTVVWLATLPIRLTG